MSNAFLRTEMLLGREAMQKLSDARVAIFGVGGVGGYVLEALVRSGVGEIDVIDSDKIDETNLNRQILATVDAVGRPKTDVAEERARSINPSVKINKYPIFYLPETASAIDISDYDYVVDAIDTVSGKMEIIKRASEAGVPVISSMGTGNKLDPTALRVADIYETRGCPLARVMRGLCRKAGVKKLKVVYSEEAPVPPEIIAENMANAKKSEFLPTGTSENIEFNERTDGNSPKINKIPPASSSFVPPVAGLIIASEVVKDMIKA